MGRAPRIGARVVGCVVVVAAVVAASLTGTAGARPGTPAPAAAPGRAAEAASSPAPHPAALPVLPVASTYARQILVALGPGTDPSRAAITEAGGWLDAGVPAPFVVAVLMRRPAWLDDRLTAEVRLHLGRAPSAAELATMRARVLAGTPLEQLTLELAASADAWRAAGGTGAGYLDRTYRNLLGRSPDADTWSYWAKKLYSASARTTFVRGIVGSAERGGLLVDRAYVRHLGRAATAAERSTQVARYTAGTVGELALVPELLGSDEARGSGCDPLDARLCLLPFPNDRFTVPDAGTATGRRVAMKREWLPANKDGVHANPQELNRNDGFSVGQAALAKVPGLDLTRTGAASLSDIGSSLDADAPIVVIDADTGERHPYFAELDANIPEAERAADQLLYIRPAVNYTAGHRYVVALRRLKDASGATIPAPASFTTYRDGHPGDAVGDVEARRPHLEQLFAELAAAGVGRRDLYLAWDFTVASTENTTGRMLHIRDDALAALGGHAPAFTVTEVTDAPRAGVARRVVGTFEVPRYLSGDGSAGNAFVTGPDGLPQRNGTYRADFDCELPTLPAGTRARAVVYGHGLFGSYREVRSGAQAAMVANHDMAYCATTWIGMSEQDVGNAVSILQDMSRFPTLADRSQQGILDTIVLGRLMLAPDGLSSHAAFRDSGGDPVLDTSTLFYDGNSQGGIIGGAFVATSPDVSAGVLGVTGMNYSTLLERSVDFDPLSSIMKVTYPSAPERVLGLGLLQMLWDRAETNGYAAHLTDDPLPGSGANRVLLHTALGDHQVATFTAEIEARTAGMAVHRPVYGPGRTHDVAEAWGLPALVDGSTGSALVLWDSGSPVAPLANVPPRDGDDPHSDPRNGPAAQVQKSAFLRSGGTIVEVCGLAPCTTPG